MDLDKLRERKMDVVRALRAKHGNVRAAAKLLGITVRTMYYRNDMFEKHGLGKIDFDSYRPVGWRREED